MRLVNEFLQLMPQTIGGIGRRYDCRRPMATVAGESQRAHAVVCRGLCSKRVAEHFVATTWVRTLCTCVTFSE